MQLIFLYGQPAAGKLTIARKLAGASGLAVFHNHLVVDTVGAVFPFGSEPFTRLREQLWLAVIGEAATAGRSLIFTYAPEPTVEPGFAKRVRDLVEARGGEVVFVSLTVSPEVQETRLTNVGRAEFGKLRDVEFLRALRPDLDACMAAMPAPALTLAADVLTPDEAAEVIARLLRG